MEENNNKRRTNKDIWVAITTLDGKIDGIHIEITNLCKKVEKYDEIANKRIDSAKTQIEDLDEKKISKGMFITVSLILGIIISFATILNFFVK